MNYARDKANSFYARLRGPQKFSQSRFRDFLVVHHTVRTTGFRVHVAEVKSSEIT